MIKLTEVYVIHCNNCDAMLMDWKDTDGETPITFKKNTPEKDIIEILEEYYEILIEDNNVYCENCELCANLK